MAFFQNSVINKYISSLDKQKVSLAYANFRAHFHNATIQENLRGSKEEQYQGEFLIDLFVNVLGYTKNPTPNFNLTTEYKNVKYSKKADGAIIINPDYALENLLRAETLQNRTLCHFFSFIIVVTMLQSKKCLFY